MTINGQLCSGKYIFPCLKWAGVSGQTGGEEKLFKTSVNQKIDENESVFSLTNENCKSTFRVTYPAYAAINIDITHDNGFETRRRKTSFRLKELDGDRIGAVLDDFIKEFQTLSK